MEIKFSPGLMSRSKWFTLLGLIVGVNVFGILILTFIGQKNKFTVITTGKLTWSFQNDTKEVLPEETGLHVTTPPPPSSPPPPNSSPTSNNSSKNQTWIYQHLDINNIPKFNLTHQNISKYFRVFKSLTCFINGTDWTKTENLVTDSPSCVCLRKWHGNDCGIPEVVWNAVEQKKMRLRRRKIPRRIIHGLNVNHEFDMLEIRVHELEEVVDVYLVCESNFTAYGEVKPLNFLEKFRSGYLSKFQDKIIYVFQDVFPPGGKEDGWIADSYQRTFLTRKGLKHISGMQSDDLFLLLDADEIPKREVILFLKLYDGFPEPVRLSLRWTVYGFFWHVPNKVTNVCAVSSINTLHYAMADDGILLRGQKIHPSLKESFKSAGGVFRPWTIGGDDGDAGWHCSWCFTPEGVLHKLVSAQNGDKPRWGDYPEKRNLTYIKKLIKTGTWFNDEDKFEKQDSSVHVPDYVANHGYKFDYLLVNHLGNTSLLEKLKTLNNILKIF